MLAVEKQNQIDFKNNVLKLERIDPNLFLKPETKFESDLLLNAEFVEGLFWGEPRFGHPEGKVILHIREVLDNIDRLRVDNEMRSKLRIIALVHDTFKYKEALALKIDGKRDWSKHHSVWAKNFLSAYTNDSGLLDVLELHDEAYYCWRLHALEDKLEESQQRLITLLERLGDNKQLFYLFFKCDTRTGDKIQTPVRWFERCVPNLQVVDF